MNIEQQVQNPKYDPLLDREILPKRLHEAAHEIALMLSLNGHELWCYGPIADRNLVEELRKALREVVSDRDKFHDALLKIQMVKWGNDGDCGVNGILDTVL